MASPPTHNFDKIPIVTCGPYAYDAAEAERLYEKEQAIVEEVREQLHAAEEARDVEIEAK